MNIKEALSAMQNLGVSLNDYDSEALDCMCDFVHDALADAKNLPLLPAPDRIMWQYGQRIEHYTASQVHDYATLVRAQVTTNARSEARPACGTSRSTEELGGK